MNQRNCEGCGEAISNEAIIAKQAGLVGGVLLCSQCIMKKREELLAARQTSQPAHASAGGNSPEIGTVQGSVYLPPVTEGKRDVADEALSLISETEMRVTGSNRIRSFAEASTLAGVHHEDNYKRPLAGPNDPATRCRTFHGKLTEAGLAHMDEQINEWLDGNPQVFIKSCASTVGVFEGKTKEPHLLVTMFY